MFSTREILLKVNIQKLNRGMKKEGWTGTQDFHDSETKIPFKLVYVIVYLSKPTKCATPRLDPIASYQLKSKNHLTGYIDQGINMPMLGMKYTENTCKFLYILLWG